MKNINNNSSKCNLNLLIDPKLPSFVSFYKIYLVDELATLENPLEVPHGYCSCVGYLMNSADRLGSLKISGVQRYPKLVIRLFTID